jgi:hypothetical protein
MQMQDGVLLVVIGIGWAQVARYYSFLKYTGSYPISIWTSLNELVFVSIELVQK